MDLDSRQTELLWFTLLNMGNKIGCSSYTDCGLGRKSSGSPGDRRLYVRAESFGYKAIVAGMRRGRTVATSGGPIFPFFSINGHGPGETIVVEEGEIYTAEIRIHSLHPLRSAQLICRGRVVEEFDVRGKAGTIVLSVPVQARGDAWYVLRVENDRTHWAITSPVYFEEAAPQKPTQAQLLLLEISNATRFIELRKDFFAHLIVTLSEDQAFESVTLLRDGVPVNVFLPTGENHIEGDKLPVTARAGEYHRGWVWHPGNNSRHFQADWPVNESGWYVIEVKTRAGRILRSDSMYFDAQNPNSQELSVAMFGDEENSFSLRGYGEEMPLSEIALPFEGDRWWYPESAFWRVTSNFSGLETVLSAGSKEIGERLFRSSP